MPGSGCSPAAAGSTLSGSLALPSAPSTARGHAATRAYLRDTGTTSKPTTRELDANGGTAATSWYRTVNSRWLCRYVACDTGADDPRM